MPTPTYTDNFVENLIISKISKPKFEELSGAGMLNENEIYLIENDNVDALSGRIINVAPPISGTDGTNKQYVDGLIDNLDNIFYKLPSGGIPLTDIASGVIPDKTSDLTNDGYNGENPFITMNDVSGKADTSYVSANIDVLSGDIETLQSKSVLHVYADLDISTLTISNPSVPFSDALAAYQSEKPVLLSLKYSNTPAYLNGFVINGWDSSLEFGIIVEFNGEPSMVLAFWSSSGWETTVYTLAQLPDSIFHVHGELDLSTMSISNIDQTFSDAYSAAEMGRTVFLTLNTGGDNNYHSFAFYTYTDMMIFQLLIYVSLGDGDHPYLLQAIWYDSEEWNVDYYTLAERSDIDDKADNDIIAPEFSTGQNYNIGDAVIYDGVRYVCHTAIVNAQWWTGDESSTYFVNEHVNYLGRLYKCTTAVTATGDWTGSTNWEEVDMTSPDATVDITNDGFLRVVSADGEILWAEGYNLSEDSSGSMSNWSVKGYTFATNVTSGVTVSLPSVMAGKVGDFILDVVNPPLDTTSLPTAFSDSATYAAGDIVSYDSKIWRCVVAVETAGAWTGTTNWEEAWPYITLAQVTAMTASVVVPAGEDLQEMLTFAPGTMCELYFTQTAFNVDSKPTWKVVRQDVEDGGAS